MFSVVIPCHNHEKYVLKAVFSARKAGAEQVIVVVNDGHIDRVSAALAEFTGESWLQVIDLETPGSGGARNAGFDVARERYVFFLDADDMLFPRSLFHLGESLRRAPEEVGMACGWLQLIDPDGKPLRDITHPNWAVEQVPYWFVPNSGNHCISRDWGLETISKYGYLYDPRLKSLSENAALWLRMHRIGCRALLAPRLTVQYRQHSGGSRSCFLTKDADPRQRVWDLYDCLGYNSDIAKAISILTKLKRFHPEFGVSNQYLSELFAQRWFRFYILAVPEYESMLNEKQKAYWGNLFDFFRLLGELEELPTFESVQSFLQ